MSSGAPSAAGSSVDDLPNAASSPPPGPPSAPDHGPVDVFVAIGGNSGHRARNIQSAMALLHRTPGLRVLATSFLYETTPVGSPEQHARQPRFLNGALKLEATSLTPLAVLDALQSIEQRCGRTRDASGVRNGPRTIDLDVIFYRDATFHMRHQRLELPHPRWHQRGFVLAPMRDLVAPPSTNKQANTTQSPSGDSESTASHVERAWSAWLASQSRSAGGGGGDGGIEREVIYRVIPFGRHEAAVPDSHCEAESDVWRVGEPIGVRHPQQQQPCDDDEAFPRAIHSPTRLMGILNLTPDSFSDGAGVQTTSIEASIEAAHAMWTAGADIVDIGGESTRPGSSALTPVEELARILPVIRGIRARHPRIKMSVDTYHPSVARAAVHAGCVMINDVMGGTFSEPRTPASTSSSSSAGVGREDDTETMFDVAAELDVPFVCMHMRGTPQTMTRKEHMAYGQPVHDQVRLEQAASVERALTTRAPLAASPSSSSAGSGSSSSGSSVLSRWHLITDPGIGFAKTGAHALSLLRRLPEAKVGAHPMLVGTSRKGFIGRVLAKGQAAIEEREEAKGTTSTTAPTPTPTLVDRVWGTSATVAASIAGGADIIRVHDVREMRCVRDIADQIYKHRE